MTATDGQSVQVVLSRDLSSGRFHKRYLDADTGTYASFEADNLDSAGVLVDVLWSEIETAEPDALCARCFGKERP